MHMRYLSVRDLILFPKGPQWGIIRTRNPQHSLVSSFSLKNQTKKSVFGWQQEGQQCYQGTCLFNDFVVMNSYTQTLSRSVEAHLSAQLKWNEVILGLRLKGYADLMWNVPACQHFICNNNIHWKRHISPLSFWTFRDSVSWRGFAD